MFTHMHMFTLSCSMLTCTCSHAHAHSHRSLADELLVRMRYRTLLAGFTAGLSVFMIAKDSRWVVCVCVCVVKCSVV
jgi:hypothetical protein